VAGPNTALHANHNSQCILFRRVGSKAVETVKGALEAVTGSEVADHLGCFPAFAIAVDPCLARAAVPRQLLWYLLAHAVAKAMSMRVAKMSTQTP